MWRFPKLGYHFEHPHNKDYNALVFILWSPYFGKLPLDTSATVLDLGTYTIIGYLDPYGTARSQENAELYFLRSHRQALLVLGFRV